MSGSAKVAFYWAVVGNGNPEPVAVEGERGSRKAYTIGCPDPYMIDEAKCPCRIVPDWEQDARNNRYIAKLKLLGDSEPLVPPFNPLSRSQRRALEAEFAAELAPKHSYAGFGRRAA